jgi:hypothetical protein
MQKRLIVLCVVLGLLAAACGTMPGSSATSTPQSDGPIPSCDDIPRVSAPESWYADTPRYVASEMPIDEVRSWAEQQPGYQTIWIDRDHNGWITVAFSSDAAERQADLQAAFPGVGVVAVQVDWTLDELLALQQRIGAELHPLIGSLVTVASDTTGVVEIGVGALTDQIRAEIESRFAGEPVCLWGRDPSTLPAPGPQPTAGSEWRLLVDEARVGRPYRTGIATDPASLERLWEEIGLTGPIPEVDFRDEVVIWFGAVYGSSCPNLRLDDVVVQGDLVYAEIVLPDAPIACTADANPHAYVVAVDRSKLPVGPFTIQLSDQDPPPGAPEERTVVDADLSQPGAVAEPGEVGPDLDSFETYRATFGDFIEPGFPVPYLLDSRCGIEWLGEFNDYRWRTTDPMPDGWAPLIRSDGTLEVSLVLSTGSGPTIEATAGGDAVIYRPTNKAPPDCP